MKIKKKLFFCLGFVFLGGLHFSGCISTTKGESMKWTDIAQGKIDDKKEIYALFPASADEIKKLQETACQETKKKLDAFVALDLSEYNKTSVLHAFEEIGAAFSSVASCISMLEMLHPEKEVRTAAHQAIVLMQEFDIEYFSNKKVYAVFKRYVEEVASKEELTAEEKYGLDEIMRDFKLSGLGLQDEEFKHFQELQKEQMILSLQFETNINEDESKMFCSEDQLKGMNPSFLSALQKNDEGKLIVRTDYPTSAELLSFCTVEPTREAFWKLFNKRAYPKNELVLERILILRAELARMLGFNNYAELNISTKMAKNPAKVRTFLKSISTKARKKCTEEVHQWLEVAKDILPSSDEKKLAPWNVQFIKKAYERTAFNYDERDILPYFSMEKTIAGIFDIYQNFLSLRFEIEKASGSWHDDVQMITVYDKEATVPRGYIFIDLHPRPAKYSHACHAGVIKPTFLKDGNGATKSVGVLVANFPRATKTEPALLKHSDVVTFFHEFGHAMHHLLGVTELPRFSGTSVKWDFVEMPSQMFEEWVWQPEMIKKMSTHYQTNEPLSDEMVQKMIAKKKYDAGYSFCRQLVFADFSLTLYEMDKPDIHAVLKKMLQRYLPELSLQDEHRMYASFGHLMGYAASYYGYMWSLVFACDIFGQLKAEGLTPQAGARFADMLLAKGGSVDPAKLLKNFLGRKPSEKAFFEAYDLK
jgi:thimet oligopeptidase